MKPRLILATCLLACLISSTAVQNLYHALAHAVHMMNGTWLYFASERQAIQEENIFHRQPAKLQGRTPTQRLWVTGLPITDFESSFATVYGTELP